MDEARPLRNAVQPEQRLRINYYILLFVVSRIAMNYQDSRTASFPCRFGVHNVYSDALEGAKANMWHER